MELRIAETLAIRGGYKFYDAASSHWSAGIGLIIPMEWLGSSRTELDYAYSPYTTFDSQAHRFSLSFDFGKVGSDTGQLIAIRSQMTQEMADIEKARLSAQQTLEDAERSRLAAEEARLAAEETERRLKAMENEMAARLEKAKEIAASSEGKIEVEQQEYGAVLEKISRYPTMECPNRVTVKQEFAIQVSLTEELTTAGVT